MVRSCPIELNVPKSYAFRPSSFAVPAIETQISYLTVGRVSDAGSEAAPYYNFGSDIRCRITRASAKAQGNEAE